MKNDRIGNLAVSFADSLLFIQVYPFHKQKLEQRKYDEYGIRIIFCTGACLYISHHFYSEICGNGE
ncbi:hypothetical protein EKU37_28605 [Bacillus anthracis]|nr:hypothetical protein [Bacillus anthracis]